MFEAFKIGIKLSLVNEVSHGLVTMASDFGRAEHAAESLRRRLSQMSTSTRLLFGGALAIGVGASMALAFKPAIEQARKWETAQAKFKLFGMTGAQNTEAFQFAQHMNIAGSSYVENLQKMTEAQGAFREANLSGSEALAGAKLAAPMLARLAYIAKASGHEMSEADDKNLIRAIEMSGGLKDAKTFNSRADAIYKLVGSSGGNVGYEDVRAFYARGGVSAKNLTEEALMKLEPVIGEMKGTSAGTALMTTFNRLNGIIKLPNQTVHELVNAGLWNRKNIDWNSQGGVKNIRSQGLLKGADLLQTDPVKWEKEVLEPMYARMGLDTQKKKDIYNARLFGRTGGAEMSLIQSQAATIERSPGAIRQHLGIIDAAADLHKTYNGLALDAGTKWRDLLTNIGTAILPNVNSGLSTLNGILKSMADWTRDNPGITRLIVYIGLATAGFLILGGALAIVAGVLALIEWPITVAVAAIAGLIALGEYLHSVNWGAIWQGIKDGFMSFIGWISDAWKHRPTWMGGDGVVNATPQVGVSQATQADKDYNAALNGTPTGSSGFVRPRGGGGQSIQANLFLTESGKKHLASTVGEHLATGVVNPFGAGGFDGRMHQPVPGQGY